MDKIRPSFDYGTGKGDDIKNIESTKQRGTERAGIRSKISEALKQYHKKLVASGYPENYILKPRDVIDAINGANILASPLNNPSQLRTLVIVALYGTGSLNDVLEALGLPYNPKRKGHDY